MPTTKEMGLALTAPLGQAALPGAVQVRVVQFKPTASGVRHLHWRPDSIANIDIVITLLPLGVAAPNALRAPI